VILNENIEQIKILLSQENTGITIKNSKESKDLFGYLSDIVGNDLSSEETDNLEDVCNAIIAQSSQQLPQEPSIIITSERLQKKADFFKKYFNVNFVMLETLITPES
jgi:hypothetical protein